MTEAWDLSCPDWQERIVAGRSLMPDLPLFQDVADLAVDFFDHLRIPDITGTPMFRDVVDNWFRDIVRAAFGSWDPQTGVRHIKEIFCLAPKGSGKTTLGAGLMLTALLMNETPNVDMLLIAPKQNVADKAFAQASAMIELDENLKVRFHLKPYTKEIVDRQTGATLAVKTFGLDILTGSIPDIVLLDELHVLGPKAHTDQIIRQIRGGLQKKRSGLLVFITTQSDSAPAGAFREELIQARQIRDGVYKGRKVRALLPILYEFPPEMAKDIDQWSDPDNWHIVMPSLGKVLHLNDLILDWESERQKGQKNTQIWASQHLNIEIGVGLGDNQWAGVRYWLGTEKSEITLESIIQHCEVAVAAVDGGGLDDLFGFGILGRHKETKHWWWWSHSWCNRGVLTKRKTIAGRLLDFERDGYLTIVDDGLDDVSEIIEYIQKVKDAGILHSVAVDPYGLGLFVDALDAIGITQDSKGTKLVGVGQGTKLMSAINSSARMLAAGILFHSKDDCMTWAVGNLKIEATAAAIMANKANSGDAKIDPAMAFFDGCHVMATNPTVEEAPKYQMFFLGANGARAA
jgi:phage terminase large subunit-like protein